jgi:hypothetical protein
MTLKEYDFTKMSKQDSFKAKLANEEVDFGHIKVWQYKAFQKFCLEHGFVSKRENWMGMCREVTSRFVFSYTYNTAAHLPFGWIAVWLTDLTGRKIMGSAYDRVPMRKNYQKDPEYDYVVIRNDMPFAI